MSQSCEYLSFFGLYLIARGIHTKGKGNEKVLALKAARRTFPRELARLLLSEVLCLYVGNCMGVDIGRRQHDVDYVMLMMMIIIIHESVGETRDYFSVID